MNDTAFTVLCGDVSLRIFRQRYKRSGESEARYTDVWYYAQMVHRRRKAWPVGDVKLRRQNESAPAKDGLFSDQRAAGSMAKKIYLFLLDKTRGIEDVDKQFYPEKGPPVRHREKSATVGEVIAAYKSEYLRLGVTKGSAEDACQKLMLFLRRSDAGLAEKPFSDRSGAKIDYSPWLGLPVSALDLRRAHAMQNTYLEEADDEVELERAKINANSILRGARSVFKEDALTHYHMKGLRVPDAATWSFLRAKPLKVSKKHRMLANEVVGRIVEDADRLQKDDPNAWRVLMLGCHLGLRRKEIANARWPWFTVGDDTWLQIRIDGQFKPKAGHIGDVRVYPHVYAQLVAKREGSDYLIEGKESERQDVNGGPYGDAFKRLTVWLRARGVDVAHPIHELRKLWATAKVTTEDMFAAQSEGRWEKMDTMLKHYLERKMPKTLIWWWETGKRPETAVEQGREQA